MEYRWVGKTVDLQELSKRVEEFYKSKGFETKLEYSDGFYKVNSVLRIENKLRISSARIHGSPNDFVVEFLSGKGERFSNMLVHWAAMFGGGVFMLDGLRSQEFYERLERDFWIFVEKAVGQLAVL